MRVGRAASCGLFSLLFVSAAARRGYQAQASVLLLTSESQDRALKQVEFDDQAELGNGMTMRVNEESNETRPGSSARF